MLYVCLGHEAIYAWCKMDKMAPLGIAVACNSNTHRRQLQMRWKLCEQSRHSNLSPRIQASEEGIARTNLPPCSRTSQDPKQSTLQITPFDTMPTGTPLRRALSNTTASERQYTLSLRLNALVLCVSHFSYSYGSN